MQYEIYDSTKHTLEVGTKIRLGGREGRIAGIESAVEENDSFEIVWSDDIRDYIFCLQRFTFEIAVSPITIDKRVKKNVLYLAGQLYDGEGAALDSVVDYLNSLEET